MCHHEQKNESLPVPDPYDLPIDPEEAIKELNKKEPLVIRQLRQNGFKFGKENDTHVIMSDDVSPNVG